MWSQVFVVQPADRMDPEWRSGVAARVLPPAGVRWFWVGVWPVPAIAPGAKATAAAAAAVKTVATRIAFRGVVVLVAGFMN